MVALWTQEKLFGIDVMALTERAGRRWCRARTSTARSLAVARRPLPGRGLAYRTDSLKLRQNESIVLLDAHGKRLGTLAESWRSATGSPFWGR